MGDWAAPFWFGGRATFSEIELSLLDMPFGVCAEALPSPPAPKAAY
jgi:hypothetical protein